MDHENKSYLQPSRKNEMQILYVFFSTVCMIHVYYEILSQNVILLQVKHSYKIHFLVNVILQERKSHLYFQRSQKHLETCEYIR